MALITNTEFKAFRDIGVKHNDDLLTECIHLAEKNELYDLLGGFYFDVLDNKDEAVYADLMNGSQFTYDSESYTHEGIKALLADLAYARYLNRVSADFTPFGFVQKQSEDSNQADRRLVNDLVIQARKDADAKYAIIKIYLKENDSTFDRFGEGENPSFGQGRRRWSIIK